MRGSTVLAYALFWTVATAPPVAPQAGTQRWSFVEELRVGSVDHLENSLTRIGGLAVGRDGAMFVLQPDDRLVRVYDRTGKFVRTIGRRGGGPGEFERPMALGWIGDTLWVADAGLSRLTYFSAAGELLGTTRVIAHRQGITPLVSGVPGALVRGGGAVSQMSTSAHLVHEGAVTALPLVHTTREGEVLDTLRWMPVQNEGLAIRRSSAQGGLFARQPLSDAPIWAAAPDGHAIVIIDRPASEGARQASFRVTKLTPEGDVAFDRSYGYRPRRIERRTHDSLVSIWVDAAQKGRSLFASQTDATRAVRAALYLPNHYPPVSALVVGRDGSNWLRREKTPGDAVWQVLDGNGNIRAAVVLPGDLDILQAGDRTVWGSVYDDLGVPFLVRYRLASASLERAERPD